MSRLESRRDLLLGTPLESAHALNAALSAIDCSDAGLAAARFHSSLICAVAGRPVPIGEPSYVAMIWAVGAHQTHLKNSRTYQESSWW
jgi:hypothetical protein